MYVLCNVSLLWFDFRSLSVAAAQKNLQRSLYLVKFLKTPVAQDDNDMSQINEKAAVNAPLCSPANFPVCCLAGSAQWVYYTFFFC